MTVIHRPSPLTTDAVQAEHVTEYQEHGFVKVEGMISKEEAAFYREEVMNCIRERNKNRDPDEPINIDQHVNIWRENEILKNLTLHPRVAAAAQKLAGVALRLWHDHIISKPPHNGVATEFHQDQPYWPHVRGNNPISCWIALCDVPQKRGCMSFIPKAHTIDSLPAQSLHDSGSLFELAPELEYADRITKPLRAGDCTFHHGNTPHTANANETDLDRTAHIIIYMDADTKYVKKGHIVTDPMNLIDGCALDDPDMFPSF